jgi:hypothetical protein
MSIMCARESQVGISFRVRESTMDDSGRLNTSEIFFSRLMAVFLIKIN